MQRHNIILRDSTDVHDALRKLRDHCGAGEASECSLYEQAATTVKDFARRGQELAAVGSQFHAERVVSVDGVSVTVTAKYGAPRSLLGRVRSALGF